MIQLLFGCVSVSAVLVLLVSVSSRPLGDLFGYARAAVDTTVAELETNLPEAVRDQKVRNQLDDARGELIDRRVSLSLASGQIQDLADEIARLKSAIARRETILADAWPAMEAAVADRAQPVVFAGTTWQPGDLSTEVDRLLSEQDRDEIQLQVRSEALERLQASVSESQSAVSEMETRLQKAESEFDVLKLRREQAESESDLLSLLAAAGNEENTSTAQLAKDLTDMEQQVREQEARNNARRDTVPPSESRPSRLTKSYERLERLKKLHTDRKAEVPAEKPASVSAPQSESVTELMQEQPSAADVAGKTNVTIVIQNSAEGATPDDSPVPAEPATEGTPQ